MFDDKINRMLFSPEPDETVAPREKWFYSLFFGCWILPYGEAPELLNHA